MCCCQKACLFGDVRDALVGLFNQVLRSLDPHAVDILDQAQVDGLFKQPAQVVRADVKLAGNAGQGQFFRVMLGDIGLNLLHDMVADAAVFAALGLLLFAQVLQLQQQGSQQHLTHRLALGAGLLLQFQQLLQHRVDVILLLDIPALFK